MPLRLALASVLALTLAGNTGSAAAGPKRSPEAAAKKDAKAKAAKAKAKASKKSKKESGKALQATRAAPAATPTTDDPLADALFDLRRDVMLQDNGDRLVVTAATPAIEATIRSRLAANPAVQVRTTQLNLPGLPPEVTTTYDLSRRSPYGGTERTVVSVRSQSTGASAN